MNQKSGEKPTNSASRLNHARGWDLKAGSKEGSTDGLLVKVETYRMFSRGTDLLSNATPTAAGIKRNILVY